VRLVDHQERGPQVVRQVEPAEHLERRDRDAAAVEPGRRSLLAVVAVHHHGRQVGVLLDLALPVGDDARRAHDQHVRAARGHEVRGHGDGLHGLAQTHLVAEDRAPLDQRVLGAELLVATQVRAQQGAVQRLRLDPAHDVGG
jgi:hypothetical protein